MKVYEMIVEWNIEGEAGVETYIYDSKEKAQKAFKDYVYCEKNVPVTWVNGMLDIMRPEDDSITYFEAENYFKLTSFDSFEEIWFEEKEVK